MASTQVGAAAEQGSCMAANCCRAGQVAPSDLAAPGEDSAERQGRLQGFDAFWEQQKHGLKLAQMAKVLILGCFMQACHLAACISADVAMATKPLLVAIFLSRSPAYILCVLACLEIG